MDILLAGPSNFDYEAAREWMIDRRGMMVQIVAAYLTGLYVSKRAMQKRPAYDLKWPLIIWNVGLAAFSFAGFYYVASEYWETYQLMGFRATYCHKRQFFRGTTGYWVWLFTVSKIFELGDSFFLVFRKRPLTFLQWYHHALTLAYCWMSYIEEPVFNRIGTLSNFTVHSFMYTYFLLRALKVRMPAVIARSVTTMQILQFVVSTTLLVHGFYELKVLGVQCDWPLTIGYVALIMNGSYLVLFVDFFIRAYFHKQHSTYKRD